MSFRWCCLVFLLLAVASGLVKFSMDASRTGVLIDVTFIASAFGCVVCGVGHLGRRLADLTSNNNDRHRSSPPHAG